MPQAAEVVEVTEVQEVGEIQAEEPSISFAMSDLSGLVFEETGGKTETTVEVMRDGSWQHPEYGKIEITPAFRASVLANFQANVRKTELPMDYDHERGKAAGWFRELINDGDSLRARMELTPSAANEVREGQYRFFSPEWDPNWKDPETGKRHGPTLLAGALTNRPFFRGMAAITASECRGKAPEKETVMAEPITGAETAPTAEAQALIAAEVETIRGRLTAVEAENAALKATEKRRGVVDMLSSLRFSEGKSILAPASQTALTDVLMGLDTDDMAKAAEAVKSLVFVELGERGFTAAEGTEDETALTASEERVIAETAKQTGVPVDDLRKQFSETKRARIASAKAAGLA